MTENFDVIRRKLLSSPTPDDTISLLQHLPESILFNHCAELLRLIESLKQRAESEGQTELLGQCLMIAGCCQIVQRRFGDARLSLERSLRLFGDLGLEFREAVVLGPLAWVYHYEVGFEAALDCYSRSIVILEASDDKAALGRMYLALSSFYTTHADYSAATEFLERAEELAADDEDYYVRRRYYFDASNLYRLTGDYDRALEYLRRCQSLNKRYPDLHHRVYALLYAIEIDLRRSEVPDLDSYHRNMNRLMAAVRGLSDDSYLYNILVRAGEVYHEYGDHHRSLSLLQRAQAIYDHTQLPDRARAGIYLKIGKALLLGDEVEAAVDYLERAHLHGQRVDEVNAGCLISDVLAEAYERQGEFGKAYECMRNHVAMYKVTEERRSRRDTATRKLKDEVTRIRQQLQRQRRQLQVVQRELDAKRKEMAMNAIKLSRSNSLLSEVEEGLRRMLRSKALSAKALQTLLYKIGDARNAGREWEAFERQFNELHPEFQPTLVMKFPGLLPSELTMCALLRLNLSSKHIAALRGLTTRSVETIRYRIRKKMRLDHDVNLTSFLMDIPAGRPMHEMREDSGRPRFAEAGAESPGETANGKH